MFRRFTPTATNTLACLLLLTILLQQHFTVQAKPFTQQDIVDHKQVDEIETQNNEQWVGYSKLRGKSHEIFKRSTMSSEDDPFDGEDWKVNDNDKRTGIEVPISPLSDNESSSDRNKNGDSYVRSKVSSQNNNDLIESKSQSNIESSSESSNIPSVTTSDLNVPIKTNVSPTNIQVEGENSLTLEKQEKGNIPNEKTESIVSNVKSSPLSNTDSSSLMRSGAQKKADSNNDPTKSGNTNPGAQITTPSKTDSSNANSNNDKTSGVGVRYIQNQINSVSKNSQVPQSLQDKQSATNQDNRQDSSDSPASNTPISTSPTINSPSNTQSEPIIDKIGNSGKEVVTTEQSPHSNDETAAGKESEGESSENSEGSEIGHFQVDDKSADLEINANSAGVKVKAKPASLQVVSRPGAHPPQTVVPIAPMYHHHSWYPGFRRGFPYRRHHLRRRYGNPYGYYHRRWMPRRHRYFYSDMAYRRHFRPHWYHHHRHRHHFFDPYSYMAYPHDLFSHRFTPFDDPYNPYRRSFPYPFNPFNSPEMPFVPPQSAYPMAEGFVPQIPLLEKPMLENPSPQIDTPAVTRQNIQEPAPINFNGFPSPGIMGSLGNEFNGFPGGNTMGDFEQMGAMNQEMNGYRMRGMSELMGGMNGGMGEMDNQLGEVNEMGAVNNGLMEGMKRYVPEFSRNVKKTVITEGKQKKEKSAVRSVTKSGQLKVIKSKLRHPFKMHISRQKAQTKKLNKAYGKTNKRKRKYKRSAENMNRKSKLKKQHVQKSKEETGSRKNSIVIHRPPIIYHPPPEVYHRPDIVVHRAPIMLHRPPIVYHQPPVVVHRPAIIYHQPEIVFHQPPPVVNQPVLQSHDTWVTRPQIVPSTSTMSHSHTYYGIPDHVYGGMFDDCHGPHCSFRKQGIPHKSRRGKNANNTTEEAKIKERRKREAYIDYLTYLGTLWAPRHKRDIDQQYDSITSSSKAKERLTYSNKNDQTLSKRDSLDDFNKHLYHAWNSQMKRDTKDQGSRKKKKDVVVNRPPIIYHPPPEIYHRPDIVVHRPPLVIHRPPIIYHQPPVIVHRPAVVYHQPPIVFHQPPPAVSQPLLYSHDSFMLHPSFYATHHGSIVRDFGHYVGVPNMVTNYGSPLFHTPPAFGKRSRIPHKEKQNGSSLRKGSKKSPTKKHDSTESAKKKNAVVIRRPPIIYHPPPEVYHRPDIVVHRPPILINRAPIVYHQPAVVVHRPAIVYHQPSLVFHQPPPVVRQPIMKAHDTWVAHPVLRLHGSHILHHATYVGVPSHFHWGQGWSHHDYSDHAYGKSKVPEVKKLGEENATPRNKINKSVKPKNNGKHASKKSNLKKEKTKTMKGGKKHTVIVKRPPVIYHPPPEVFHRPDIVVHRPSILVHRAPIVYHQAPVIVHRPAIVYHQPSLVFHQPAPVVRQPIYKSHDTWVPKPVYRLHKTLVHPWATVSHVPHAYYHGHGSLHFLAYEKSRVPQSKSKSQHIRTRDTVERAGNRTSGNKYSGKELSFMSGESSGDSSGDFSGDLHDTNSGEEFKENENTETNSKVSQTETGSKKDGIMYHKQNERAEKPSKKNSVVIQRPPIIFHPPPEVYHRPNIVVHRPPIVMYRAPIVYHQPPVVVHRPAIVYHQPPLVFHQPPPVVHQPVMQSHDTWVTKAVTVPYSTHIEHLGTYHGVPQESMYMHGVGPGAFVKSAMPEIKRSEIKPKSVRYRNKTKQRDIKDKEALPKNRNKKQSIGAEQRIAREVIDPWLSFKNNNPDVRVQEPIGALSRILRETTDPLASFQEKHPDSKIIQPIGAKERIQRTIEHQMTRDIGINYPDDELDRIESSRTRRAIEEPLSFLHNDSPQPNNQLHRDIKTKRSKTPHATKKYITVVHRPPIIWHPPGHIIHPPSVMVHRPPIVMHRHPLIFNRPPLLVHRPPIIIHRHPLLIHRPPIIMHRPPLVIHRHPFVIHRMPYVVHPHPFIIRRPPVVFHHGPHYFVHHSHYIHHYPSYMMHQNMMHMNPFGKSKVSRVENSIAETNITDTAPENKHKNGDDTKNGNRKTSKANTASVSDKSSMSKRSATDRSEKRRLLKPKKGKNKKDVVVNRPPIIYHPPPEVYHRPDIVVHRAPIMIHRPPIVYHQPPVVVHRPAVVYHQPPIVFHQPSPAVSQPLLYSHDNFVMHPSPVATHLGSIVNDGGHYIGIPHGTISNYPEPLPHGRLGGVFAPPTLNAGFAGKRTTVAKPEKNENQDHLNTSGNEEPSGDTELNDSKGTSGDAESGGEDTAVNRKNIKQGKPAKKNKIIIHRPPMIYHPPPEIYDRPNIVVHRPDLVYHQSSIVYHQPSVVVHRPPIIYRQPPVVFHQPPPMTKQPILNAHDMYTAQPVFTPHHSEINHGMTYLGAPHMYPGVWGWDASRRGSALGDPYGIAQGRSNVEKQPKQKNHLDKKRKIETSKLSKHRKRRSIETKNRLKRHHSKHHGKRHHHHNHHHHHHHHRYHGLLNKRQHYHMYPGHRRQMVVIRRPPIVYYRSPEIYPRPDIVFHRPDLIYHRPSLFYQQPPTVVHHSSIFYHSLPVVFHNAPPVVTTPVIHSREFIVPHVNHVLVPQSSVVQPFGGYTGMPYTMQYHNGNYHSDMSLINRSHLTKPSNDSNNTNFASNKSDVRNSTKGSVGSESKLLDKTDDNIEDAFSGSGEGETETLKESKSKSVNGAKKQDVIVQTPPVIIHPQPDVFTNPPVVVHQSPVVVHRPPVVVHQPPLVINKPPLIYHQSPLVMPAFHVPVYHASPGYLFPTFHYGKSKVPKLKKLKKGKKKHKIQKGIKKSDIGTKSTNDSNSVTGKKKNKVIMYRPPMIYHPPPEVYHRPDVIVHRPDIVLHRPSVVYHQPSVVVHRPPIVYRQPPVVFHQPAPMVHQPVMQAHDTYIANPVPVPYSSNVHHTATYVGAPHYYGRTSEYEYGHAFGKSHVEQATETKKSDKKRPSKNHTNKRKKQSNALYEKNQSKRDTSSQDNKTKPNIKPKHEKTKTGTRKNQVIIKRPPMIYHPPPEIYDKPDVIVHRPDIVIHRPSIVYHQPSVVVHRPPIVYRQPPVVFHQPPPMTRQPIMHALDTYMMQPVPVPYTSLTQHVGTYNGAPHYYPGSWGWGYGLGNLFEPNVVKSKVPRHKNRKLSGDDSKKIIRRSIKASETKISKPKVNKGARKNSIIVHRPPMIYHPPPEVYHRPAVVIHRPDIVIHRPSVVYHQPSVVVHRPSIIYRQPPVVFHQPPPVVRQPILHALDTYLAHSVPIPYTSHMQHAATYVGAPNYYPGGWGYGYGYGRAFRKSRVQKKINKPSQIQKDQNLKSRSKGKRDVHKINEKSKKTVMKSKPGSRKNIVIMHRPPVIYHPPPEVYHRPSVVLHRPDIVIHRPSVVFHQSPVVLHRPSVIYHQPPIVFHQPPPMVHQPIFHSHETYLTNPMFTPWASHLNHAGTYVGAPHFFNGGWGLGWNHGLSHAFGKSKIASKKFKTKNQSQKETKIRNRKQKTKRALEKTQFQKNLEIKGKSVGKETKHDRNPLKVKHSDKGAKKNKVIIQRPPLIYHPPPEIYDKPDVVVHRPDIVIHRPSIVYHQPSVVVHRPPIMYRAPPIVFHQPPPMVKQPIEQAHDMYIAQPSFAPYKSEIQHTGTYLGAPHYYPGGWGFDMANGNPYVYGSSFQDNNAFGLGGWGFGYNFGSNGPPYWQSPSLLAASQPFENDPVYSKSFIEKQKKNKQNVDKTEGTSKISKIKHYQGKKHRRDRRQLAEKTKKSPNKTKKFKSTSSKPKSGERKNIVIMRRPPLIYHPPPEVYHRPSVVLHRPDIVIHRPAVVYHQASVVVHRPPIMYHQPPVVFHQPTPMVHQPIFYSHESYLAHPAFVPYTSHVYHTGTYVGAPHSYPGARGFGYGHAWGKSHVEKSKKSKHRKKRFHKKSEINKNQNKTENLHPQKEKVQNPDKRNSIVIHRPPIIYHAPPEIYHRPDIVVHRAPIMLHRPPIIYHQPPVIVHRPAVVYHQPPIIFHQPPPAVNQPILHSQDTFVYHPAARFEEHGSVVGHSTNYIGVPSNVHAFGFEDFHGLHGVNGLHYRSEIGNNNAGNSRKEKKPETKSTISIPKMDITDTHSLEGTKTTAIVDDNLQKKTLRSQITKRQVSLLGSHSLFESISPLNKQHSTRETIEVPQTLSSIPGGSPVDIRAKLVRRDIPKSIKRTSSDNERATFKRQVSYQPFNRFTTIQSPSLANVQEGLNMGVVGGPYSPEILGNEIAKETITEPFPFVKKQPMSLPVINNLTPPISPLLPKAMAPNVNVHVETARSHIPTDKKQRRRKRQVPAILQPQVMRTLPREFFSPNSIFPLSSFNPLAPGYHLPYIGPYHSDWSNILYPYLAKHRPNVNINVQTTRSKVPKVPKLHLEKTVRKTSEELVPAKGKSIRSKRQLAGLNGAASPLLMNGLLQRYLPPYIPSPMIRQELNPYNSFSGLYNPLLHGQVLSSPFYGRMPQNDNDKDINMGRLWNDYLNFVSSLYLGHLYHHQRPKVNVDVQTSKSKIPKPIKMKNEKSSRIFKRQLYSYIPMSTLKSDPYIIPFSNPLLTQSNPGILAPSGQPHVNINVVTGKRNKIPQMNTNKKLEIQKVKKEMYKEETGKKRDDFIQSSQFIQRNQPQDASSNKKINERPHQIQQAPLREMASQVTDSQIQNHPLVSLNVQTAKEFSLNIDNNKNATGKHKRQSISVFQRLPIMQILPQTFLQNGAHVPEFNTIPINKEVKSNGMLISELQNRKHFIPNVSKGGNKAKKLRGNGTPLNLVGKQYKTKAEHFKSENKDQARSYKNLAHKKRVDSKDLFTQRRISVKVQEAKWKPTLQEKIKANKKQFVAAPETSFENQPFQQEAPVTSENVADSSLTYEPSAPLIVHESERPLDNFDKISAAYDLNHSYLPSPVTARPHPAVSVKVEVAKRKSRVSKTSSKKMVKDKSRRQFIASVPGLSHEAEQLQPYGQEQQQRFDGSNHFAATNDFSPVENQEQQEAPATELVQQGKQVVNTAQTLLQPYSQPQLQPSDGDSSVNVNIQTAKSQISFPRHRVLIHKLKADKRKKRQLFGTVPLLNPLSHMIFSNRFSHDRSDVPDTLTENNTSFKRRPVSSDSNFSVTSPASSTSNFLTEKKIVKRTEDRNDQVVTDNSKAEMEPLSKRQLYQYKIQGDEGNEAQPFTTNSQVGENAEPQQVEDMQSQTTYGRSPSELQTQDQMVQQQQLVPQQQQVVEQQQPEIDASNGPKMPLSFPVTTQIQPQLSRNYLNQMEVPSFYATAQQPSVAVGAPQPDVNVNIQTAKSNVPEPRVDLPYVNKKQPSVLKNRIFGTVPPRNSLSLQRMSQAKNQVWKIKENNGQRSYKTSPQSKTSTKTDNSRTKRQLGELLSGLLERRGGIGESNRKRPGNRFSFTTNANKPIDIVSTDPVDFGAQASPKPRIGGLANGAGGLFSAETKNIFQPFNDNLAPKLATPNQDLSANNLPLNEIMVAPQQNPVILPRPPVSPVQEEMISSLNAVPQLQPLQRQEIMPVLEVKPNALPNGNIFELSPTANQLPNVAQKGFVQPLPFVPNPAPRILFPPSRLLPVETLPQLRPLPVEVPQEPPPVAPLIRPPFPLSSILNPPLPQQPPFQGPFSFPFINPLVGETPDEERSSVHVTVKTSKSKIPNADSLSKTNRNDGKRQKT